MGSGIRFRLMCFGTVHLCCVPLCVGFVGVGYRDGNDGILNINAMTYTVDVDYKVFNELD